MRKLTLLFVLLIGFIGIGKSQETKDIFTKNSYPYYWFGIDYSNAHLIGNFHSNSFKGEKPAKVIKEKYFKGWNDLILNEREKFSVEKMFRKDFIVYDTKYIDSINQNINIDSLESKRIVKIGAKDVAESINSYKLDQKEGVGIVFLAEYLNKSVNKASYVLVVFNINTKKVLFNKRYVEDAGGFGIRNFWAGSFYSIFRKFSENEYYKLKEMYL